jgi:hypothetical protein
MPRRLIDRFRGLVGSPPRRPPSKFRTKPLRGTSPLPISVVAVPVATEEWELVEPDQIENVIEEPEQQDIEAPPGMPLARVDLWKFLP